MRCETPGRRPHSSRSEAAVTSVLIVCTDVTDAAATLSGGDITRKMKLREKQKEGRKRLKEHGSITIPQEVFVKMMRAD